MKLFKLTRLFYVQKFGLFFFCTMLLDCFFLFSANVPVNTNKHQKTTVRLAQIWHRGDLQNGVFTLISKVSLTPKVTVFILTLKVRINLTLYIESFVEYCFYIEEYQ
jgi:hypothetical protein